MELKIIATVVFALSVFFAYKWRNAAVKCRKLAVMNSEMEELATKIKARLDSSPDIIVMQKRSLLYVITSILNSLKLPPPPVVINGSITEQYIQGCRATVSIVNKRKIDIVLDWCKRMHLDAEEAAGKLDETTSSTAPAPLAVMFTKEGVIKINDAPEKEEITGLNEMRN